MIEILQSLFDNLTPELQQQLVDLLGDGVNKLIAINGTLGGLIVGIIGYYKSKIAKATTAISTANSNLSAEEVQKLAYKEVALEAVQDVKDVYNASQEQLSQSVELINMQSALIMEFIKGQPISSDPIISAQQILDASTNIADTIVGEYVKSLGEKAVANDEILDFTEVLKEG